MKDTELKREKGRALYAVYKDGLQQGRFVSMRDAGRYICKQPAPKFYIDARQASLLVGRILNSISLIDLNASQRRMTRRLYEDYRQYLKEHPDNTLSRERIMEILVDRPAPEFYMTDDAVRRALRKEIRTVKAKFGW